MFINKSALLHYNPPQLDYGVAVADVDADGAFEFIVAGFGFRNRVLKWDGKGLLDATPPLLQQAQKQSIGVAAGDFDGDGREEIYILNTDTFGGRKGVADNLFAYGLDGWTDLFNLTQNQDALSRYSGRSVVALDRFGRGRYSFFVATYGGALCLYELDDDGKVLDVAESAGVNFIMSGRSLLALPLLSDKIDLFAGNENGHNYLFRNNGDGTFTEVATELGLDDPYEHVRGVAALDTSSSGRFGLVYGNWEGAHRLFIPSSDGRWDDVAPPSFATPSRVRTVIVADFDNDGYEEIFFNNIGQPNRLFGWRDGNWRMLDIGEASEPTGRGTGAAIADLDSDGRLELLIAHGEVGVQPLTLYHTHPNDNAYLRVRPLTAYGAPARGAVVTVTTAERRQRRVVDGGSGYLCQMEPIAHFGLGTETSVLQVEVRFPTGATVTIDRPQANQVLLIPHPTP